MPQVNAALEAQRVASEARRNVRRAIRSAHRPPLAARLLRWDRVTGSRITDLVGSNQWAEHIQGIRNAAVHGRGCEVFCDAAAPVSAARDIALFLFEVTWLTTCGFTATHAADIVTSRAHHWSLEERIRQAQPALAELASASATTQGPTSHRAWAGGCRYRMTQSNVCLRTGTVCTQFPCRRAPAVATLGPCTSRLWRSGQPWWTSCVRDQAG